MKLAGFSIALLVLAVPVVASKPAPDIAAVNAHFETLQTENSEYCTNKPDSMAAQRIVMCRAALDELAASRSKIREPSTGQQANFDFHEASLLGGLVGAYADQDKTLSERLCKSVERIWVLRHGLLSVPRAEVSADAYQAFQQVPLPLFSLVGKCRASFGTPDQAPPLPKA